MTEPKWELTLSVTDRNNIGLIKPRKSNTNSELMRVHVTNKNGEPYDLTTLKAFFVTHFTGKDSLNDPIQKEATIINAKEGVFEFTLDEDCMQKVGRQEAYFEIYDYDKFLDATQNFTYEIISSSRNVKADFTPYIETWQEAENMLNEGTAKNLNDRVENLDLKKANIRDVENKLEGKTDNTTFVAMTEDMQKQIDNTQIGLIDEYDDIKQLNAAYPKGEKGFALVDVDGIICRFVWNGNVWDNRGPFNGMGLPNKYVTSEKIASQYNNRGFVNSGSISKLVDSGIYILNTKLMTDAPIDGSCQLLNVPTNDYLTQFLIYFNPKMDILFRENRTSAGIVSEWVSLNEIPDESIRINKLAPDFLSREHIHNADANTLVKEGHYLLTGKTSNIIEEFQGSVFFDVKKLVSGWIIQEAYILQQPSKSISRTIRKESDFFSDWESIKYLPLKGKIVVKFGDSLDGNTQNNTSISSYFSNFSGATTFNLGFGGCRMGGGQEIERWQAFSMFRLSDEIIKDNTDVTKWNIQDQAINNQDWKIGVGGSKMPYYFENTLKTLKSIDFDTVDYIVISYTWNDPTGSNLLDNDQNKYDTDTYGGALRYSLRNIIKAYPNIKILVSTGLFGFLVDSNGNFKEDTSTAVFKGGKMIDFVEKTIDICRNEFNLNYLDCYRELGVNELNMYNFYGEKDGIHGNEKHRKLIGESQAKKIISM